MDKLEQKLFKCFFLQIIWITSLKILSVTSNDTRSNLITDSCFNPPKLTPPNTEVTLDYKRTYRIKCTALSEVFWGKPHSEFKHNDFAVEDTYEEDGSYSSELTLKNVTNKHVGNYMCSYKKYKHENIEDQIELNRIANVYVFVRDPDPIVRQLKYKFSAHINSEVVIPCKPTSPDVKLELFTKNDAVVRPLNFTYNPKTGYTVKVFSNTSSGPYICSNPEAKQNSIEFELAISNYKNCLKKPVIVAQNNAHANIGEEYVLNCTVKIKQGVLWEAIWTGPDKQNIANNTEYVIDSLKNNDHVNEFGYVEGVSRLTIRNVTGERDNGVFKCKIIPQMPTSISCESRHVFKSIFIHGSGYNYIYLTKLNHTSKFEVNLPHLAPIKFEATYKSCPTVSLNNFEWYNNRNQLIDFNLSNKYNITIMNNLVILTIINVAIEDAGNYTLKAIFGKTESEVEFELIVYENTAPMVSFTEGKRMVDFNSSVNVFFKCQAVGFPPSVMNWSFTKCSTHPMWPSCSLDRTNGTAIPKLNSETNTQIMEINFITPEPGILECYAANSINFSSVKTEILISDLQSSENYLEIQGLDTRKIAVGESVTLTCSALAYNYTSNLIWYRGSLPIKETENLFISTNTTPYSFQKMLTWNKIEKDDAGVYECHATPINGGPPKIIDVNLNVSDPFPTKPIQIEDNEIAEYLKVIRMPWLSMKDFVIFALLVIVLLIIGTFILTFKIRRTGRRLRELKAVGEANLINGHIESINPGMQLDDQTILLPCIKKYEFPREQLKLGKKLGSGAFGVVVKAEAFDIMPHEDSTTVAVKSLKSNAGTVVMRALISEFKIMINLGQHLNVVNLLGAVTSNIAKGELLVIVEYCRYGNIQNFLQDHRNSFVDQINPETDEIDCTIETISQHELNDIGIEENSSNTATHLNSSGKPKRVCLLNKLDQQTKRSNNTLDETGRPTNTITTSDLVCWGFQVSRGMDYLSSRNVLHGDLAARNILLCDGNVVKICDFGLARPIYKCDNYKKKCKSPLPFKWLALESISDQVFSTYSDVWAFGIVMWELFSLAKTPYPDMKADQSLFMKLRDGYRMEKPIYANQELYDLMLNCWNVRPESRPLFGQIEKRLGKMLEHSVMDHYVDLNEPYIQVNADLVSDFKKDYLSFMGLPSEMAPPVPIPHYIADINKMRPTEKLISHETCL